MKRLLCVIILFATQFLTFSTASADTTLHTACYWSDQTSSYRGQCQLFITSTDTADIVLGVTSVGVDHDVWGTYTITGISGGPWNASLSNTSSATYPGSGNAGYVVWIRIRDNIYAEKYFNGATSFPLNYSELCQDADNWYISLGTKYVNNTSPETCQF